MYVVLAVPRTEAWHGMAWRCLVGLRVLLWDVVYLCGINSV